MPKPAKLTKPQIEYLRELNDRPKSHIRHYAPSNRLLDLGFAQLIGGSWGKRVQITDAGRERLRQIEDGEPCAPAGVTSPPR